MHKPFVFCIIVFLAVTAVNGVSNEGKDISREHCRFYRALCLDLLTTQVCLNFCTLYPDECHPSDNCGGPLKFNVIMELPPVVDQVMASLTLGGLSRPAKAAAIVAALKEATKSAQTPFINACQKLGLKTEVFWGSNVILVIDITEEELALLSKTPGTYTLRPPSKVSGPIYTPSAVNISEGNARDSPQWGVAKIRAPEAWAVNKGAGCIVGITDTGVNLGHVALKDAYAGVWSDPYYGTSGPTDVQGHGSHCAGIVLGRTYGIGVAPEAKWIACRGLNHQGSGTEGNLIKCGQFMLSASPLPNIVSNSWGGGPKNAFYNQIVTAWKGAGIIPIFAIGNEGKSGCGSANSPGDQPGLISVGSTTKDDTVSVFSSRGPSQVDGTSIKPELSAPGSEILSCGTNANDYVTLSGTSMATPNVAGAACLILTKYPGWNTEQVLQQLASTAVHPTLSSNDQNCGPVGEGEFPNNAFGAGRIDVGAALGV